MKNSKLCSMRIMKTYFVFILSVFAFVLQSRAQKNDYYHRISQETHPFSSGQSGTGANIDVLYHKIYWRINPDTTVKYLKGFVQTNFKTIQDLVSTISFDLRDVMSIDSVIFRNAQLPPASINRSGNIVTLSLGVSLANNFIDSVRIYYQGVPPAATGASQGYQRANSSTAGNYITTLSESYEDRDWWPCKADMQDKIDSMDIIVNVPWASPTAADTFWVASNGRLVDSTITGGNRTFVFKTRYPIASYLVFVSVARFNRYYRSVNVSGTEIPVVYNLFRGKSTSQYNSILSAMDDMNFMLQGFSTRFGDYPFKNEKHGYYDGLLGAGGMEHQTMSGMATSALTSSRTLAHELNHQWFGDNVTFATWNDLWLAEGFARYSEALAGEIMPSLGINPFGVRSGIKSSALSYSVSVWIPDANMVNSNAIWNSSYGGAVYERGGMIVSMLRAMSGDAKFFQALANYQTQLKGKSATADSLKNQFNTVLGVDITPFFNDYVGGSGKGTTAVGGKGYPTNTVNWNSPVANKLIIQAGGQTQSSGSNVSYFRGPVVLHLRGSVATQDTTITYFDWGGGNLSFAGNGISTPIPGGKLSYNLSFTPVNIFYDDSARTMSTGTIVHVPGLNDGSFSLGNTASASATCPAPAIMNATLSTTSDGGFLNPITLSASAGVPAGTTVSFSPNPVIPGNSTSVLLNNAQTLTPGTYSITVQGSASGVPVQTTTVNFIINTGNGPTINTQPADVTACVGTHVSFNITASAATGFQWQLSIDGGINWTNISGATANSISLSAVSVSMNSNRYRCIASTFCGSTVSGTALLKVETAATIQTQPLPVAVCEGANAGFYITANALSPISYQWQISTNGGINWVDIAGANSSAYNISNTSITQHNYAYRCVLTSAACSAPVITNVATLSVRKIPVVALVANPGTGLLPGATTHLNANVTSTGGANSYNWFYNSAPLSFSGNQYEVDIEKIGNYRVTVMEAWAGGPVCSATSSLVTIQALASNKLFVFPSPNNGQFEVAYYNETGNQAQRHLTIVNASGQKVFDKVFTINGSYTLLPIDLRQAATGIYFVFVYNAAGKKLATGKVHIR